MAVFLGTVLALWICFFVFIVDNKPTGKYEQHIEEIYGDIQFKGKILKIHQIERWGRNYGIMCISLDYTNVDDFYRFDNITCLKIKNNIATLRTGLIGSGDDERFRAILSTAYIEVNIDNNRQMVFIDSIGNKFTQNYLEYGSNNLIESDMRLCDDCE